MLRINKNVKFINNLVKRYTLNNYNLMNGQIRTFALLTKYTKDHEYVQFNEGENVGTFGISTYAASELGEVVYAEMPEVDTEIEQGGVAASVESTKAASSVYAPVDCTVTEVNEELDSNPNLISEDAVGVGWMWKGTINDTAQLDELMSQDEYDTYVEGLDEDED